MVSIPSSIFDTYNSFADDFINENFGIDCTIFYPPTQITCTSCTPDSIGHKTSNHFQYGGPAPFTARHCDFCGGTGFKESQVSETIKLRVYDQPRFWIRLSDFMNKDAPVGDLQIIGFLTDSPKLQQSAFIELNSPQRPYGEFKYKLVSECIPYGFKKNRYFIALLKKI